MKQVIHKHHIVPRYKCKELGIDPDFNDNIVEVTRLQHANIHWGYWCKDLSALLEVCSPPQYVIDMIPLGDKRDIPSAQLLAEGEIDGIDISGENHPKGMLGKKHSEETRKKISENTSGEKSSHYKHGNAVGFKSPDKEVRIQARKRVYDHGKDKELAQQKEWYANNRDKKLAQVKEHYANNKDEINAKRRAKHQREKLERQGTGTLEQFMG